MPIAAVQSAVHSETTAVAASTIAFSAATTAGNAILVVTGFTGKAKRIGSISDDGGNTGYFQLGAAGVSGAGSCNVWLCPNAAAATNITVNVDSGTTKFVTIIAEIPGLDASGLLACAAAVTVDDTSATQAHSTGSLTTTYADALLISAIGFAASTGDPFAPSAGWTEVNGSSVAGMAEGVAIQEVHATGSYSNTFTANSGTATSSTVIVAVRLAAAGPSAYNLPVGHVASGEQLYGLALPAARSLAIGHVATTEALYGLGLTVSGGGPAAYNLGIGFIPSGEALYGLALSRAGAARSLAVGHISTGEALHGLALTRPGTARSLAVGHVASGETLRGLALVRPGTARTLAVGHVATGQALYGLDIRTPATVRPSMYLAVPLYTTGVMVNTLSGQVLVPLANYDAVVER